MSDANESRVEAQLDRQKAQMEQHNARMKEWIERTKDVPMSVRERSDGLAEVMRPQNIEMLYGFTRMGWIAPQEDRASAICEALRECDFNLTPKTGWVSFCYELDLIFIALPDRTDERNIGHSALAQQIDAEVQRLKECENRIIGITHNIDFHWGALKGEVDCGLIWGGLKQAREKLDNVAMALRQSPQSPRWRERAQRKFRVQLATRLATLFEREFGLEAKPTGGSASRQLEATNDWTRFFQACALLIVGERASPDRQAVLWEAYGNR